MNPLLKNLQIQLKKVQDSSGISPVFRSPQGKCPYGTEAVQGDVKIGVFWHTQGSGKSLSMVFYAHLLQSMIESPTIVVITDCNDLDNQLYTQFACCKDFLRQVPVQAESREHLKSLLNGRKANGIIFTTMQKFEESN